jgi:hypothetical protein
MEWTSVSGLASWAALCWDQPQGAKGKDMHAIARTSEDHDAALLIGG